MTSWQRTRRALAATFAFTLAALAPAAAHAAEAHVETNPDGSRTIVFTGAAGEANDVLVDRDPGFTGDQYQLEDQNNNVTSGPGCANKSREPFAGTEPDIVRCDASATTIRVNLGDGTDSVRFGDLKGPVITDVVDAGEGDDRVTGSNGPTQVLGGGGIDNVDTRGGDDQVAGGDGNDEITSGPGSDTVSGDGGNDLIRGYAQPGTQEIGVVTRFRGGEINQLSGGDGNDTLEGDNGPDVIAGGTGDDKLNGGGAGDVLQGDAGNDTLDEGDTEGSPDGESVGAPVAADVVHGGSGKKDTATYCTRRGKGALTISLDRKANDGAKGEKDNIGPAGDVENVLGGGETPDKITGDKNANVLTGDCLSTTAPGANNKLYGAAGNDKLVGGDGDDLLNGGRGKDGFLGNEGKDTVQAKDGSKDGSINCDGHGVASKSDSATIDRSDPAAKGCDKIKF